MPVASSSAPVWRCLEAIDPRKVVPRLRFAIVPPTTNNGLDAVLARVGLTRWHEHLRSRE